MKKRRWVFRVFGVFLAIVAVTVAAAIVLNSAAAESLQFSMALRSKLSADYSQEGSQGVLGAFRLSIIGDALRDLGLSPKEADQQTAGIKIALDDPVPTATALNFDGDDPYTATPTTMPTFTNTPTSTPTNTPTKTPRPTKTPLPTSTKVPKTATPDGCCDTVKPIVTGWNLNPPTPGPLTSCSESIAITINVKDPSPSSGIKSVKVKYGFADNPGKYVYSGDFSLDSGTWNGTEWTGKFSKTIVIDHAAGHACLLPGSKRVMLLRMPVSHHPTVSVVDVTLWAIVEDNSGNIKHHDLGTYTMSCDS